MTGDAVRHGEPVATRNQRRGFGKYHWDPCEHWPDGLELQVYDDGRVKLGGWHTSVTVTDVSNYAGGASRGSSHVVACFQPAPDRGEGSR
jgi:hypothetical protein